MQLIGTPAGGALALDRPQWRRTPALVGVAWALLLINTLGSQGSQTLLPIPRPVAQMATMGALLVAFSLALLLNPRVEIRPSAYLLLLSFLVVVSVASSARLEAGYGAVFRCVRLALFVATLWLLSRWWNDAAVFLRNHIRALCAVLSVVAAGLVIAPGSALPAEIGNRLVGVLWPIPPAQVGQYGAVVAGLTIVLWQGRRTATRNMLWLAGPAIGLLMLSHTRTAIFGLVAGLVVASFAMTPIALRARRTLVWGTVGGALVMALFGSIVMSWLQRGQDAEDIANLTGRQKVWDALLAAPRSTFDQMFGVGLTNKSFNGLPIDSSWLSVYQDQGLVGLGIVAVFVATLLVTALLRPPSTNRACALFLISYCLVASYTEAGLGDASPYLLHLAVAAALVRPQRRPAPEQAVDP